MVACVTAMPPLLVRPTRLCATLTPSAPDTQMPRPNTISLTSLSSMLEPPPRAAASATAMPVPGGEGRQIGSKGENDLAIEHGGCGLRRGLRHDGEGR